ncbi:HAMP domain-containing sensor histidine kinase [Halorubrum sp. CBA1229]|jgi:signal transduction histidine kinase|uniref:sensor histidine kinase n=1 Tax=Halorubrum sp. CBA1229 TaxID=1853699 RepID=UPI000F404561|nr:HAMP domain-containing sensor histidine kinase [Halorubrum sp. CBA1229]QKY18433.1 HAMP domain-containing histidine kinase [Halorubrum sp. CBA1229]
MERRPGVAYRRPNGDPSRFVVEAGGEPRLDADALPQTDWLEATAEADRERLRSALDDGTVDVTYRLAIGDDQTWVRECGRRDESGDVVGYLLPASERAERRRRLERERERLEEFASVVSHDLRNPLSVAVGNVELAKEFEGEAADERLDRAHDALDWMDDLISDLLTLAREGRSVEETATVDLRSVVDAAWRTVGSGPEVALVVDGPLPAIECDRSRLRQALENLFRNAIEHGAPGDCSPSELPGDVGADDDAAPGPFADDGNGDVAPRDASLRIFVGTLPGGFYVADDGPGIEPSEREAVFEPGHTTADDGTGFGLAIVERIAEAHGWSVSVTERRGGGARFEFEGVDVVDEAGSAESDRGGVTSESGGSPTE